MKKQVLIFSESEDSSTSDVMEWIEYLGASSIRINTESKHHFYEMVISKSEPLSIKFFQNGVQLDTNKIESFWFRRGHFVFDIEQQNLSSIDEQFRSELRNQLQSELDSLRRTIYHTLTLKSSLGNPTYYRFDKLTVLLIAKGLGFDIPDTMVTTQDESILKFKNLHGPLITKPIGEVLMLSFEIDNNEQVVGSTYTEEVVDLEIEKKQSRFPTCVQEKLDKAFDIRIFYLNEICYSMAIFSQLDEQTTIDFRKYNEKKYHRVCPYSIPIQLSEKIVILMKKLNLDCGSLDFVLTKDGRHVFLEVNPVGQFGMVSYPCNYKLEKKIAQHLLNYERGEN